MRSRVPETRVAGAVAGALAVALTLTAGAALFAAPPAGLAASLAPVGSAAAPPPADLAARVSSILERFPAESAAARDALAAEIQRLGPGAIALVCARVEPQQKGDDSRARFAVNGLAVHATRPGAESERAAVAGALLAALAKASDPTVAAFFLSQLQLAGGKESIRPLRRYLLDETLAGPASAALLAIGGQEATKTLLSALGEAPRGARLALVQALGDARSRDAVKAILPLADSGDEGLRRAARFALANTGDPRASSVLAKTRVAASYPERQEAPVLYLLHARRLIESGMTREGLEAARAVLEHYRGPEESQHASEALALVVSALGPRALPDLLATAGSTDRRLAGTALVLAERIPGRDATLAWVGAASKAAPGARADIVAMLGRRGDTAALPFARESLASPDAGVRLAAVPAATRLGGEAVLPDLLPLFAAADAAQAAVLKTALLGYPARLVVPEAARLVDAAPPASRAAFVEVLGAKGARGEIERVFRLAGDADPAVSAAAQEALGALAGDAELARLVPHRAAVQSYVRAVGRSQAPAAGKLASYQKLLALAGGDDKRVVLAGIASVREPESLRLLARQLDDPALGEAAAASLLALASRQSPEERWLSGHEAYSALRRAEALLAEPAAKQRAGRAIQERLKQGGFVPLFDGRSLEGWTADEATRAHWRAEDGALAFDGTGASLRTARGYADFELLADWKIGKGGAGGLGLRGSSRVQIRDADESPAGSGGLGDAATGPAGRSVKADRPAGEWNSFRIVVLGDRVTVYLNDTRVVADAALETRERYEPEAASGPIELEARGTPIAFRNLFVREIPREAAAPALGEAEAREGFTPLFNGRDFEGWREAKGYAAEDGRIVVHPERGGGNLFTQREYTDFVLRFDFKLTPAANNGLGIRAPLEGDAAYAGMELQILEDGSPVYWGLEPYQYHGSVYGVVPARRGAQKPVGEWNSEEVTVRGRRVTVAVNGVTIVDADLDQASASGTIDGKQHPGLTRPKGHVGFLGHGSRLELRNIRIKELGGGRP